MRQKTIHSSVTSNTSNIILLSFRDVTIYRQHDDPIFEHISFDIEENEKVALLGYSGQGKSTILECIEKTIIPSSGKIVFNPRISGNSLPEHWRKIPIIDQTMLSLLAYCTVRENVELPYILSGYDKYQASENATRCLSRVLLPVEKWDQYPKKLSGGER